MIQINSLLLTFLAVFLLRSGVQVYLNRLNISHLRQGGKRVPEIFQGIIDAEKLKRITAYTADSENFQTISTLANQGLFLAILLSGFLPWLVRIISLWKYGTIVSGLIFYAALSIFTNLFRIPFSLYETFKIEERYGFNVMSLKTWILDFFKSIVITAILGGLLLGVLLGLVIHGGDKWWVWAWIAVGVFELILMWLFPVIILPLFNKFDPIENKGLEERIRTLMGRVGLRAKGIFKMDASKRSKHTNAFFVGIGRAKRIVLFDTLLASHTDEEILAVLGHEAGHWKKRHVLRMLILLETLSFVSFYVVAKLLNWPLLYQTFGFQEPAVYIGLFLIGTFISLLGFFAQPLESAISRKFEREADDFALELIETPEPMCSALKRLAADNLANLSPHPLYAWFYYSHPPLVERIERLTAPTPPLP
jgi:STE24 endopeptidase